MADDAAGAEQISKTKFDAMIKGMDKDGDGEVDKNEFKEVFLKTFPDTTEKDYDEVWAKIDKDGDGKLTVAELAKFYGFNYDKGSANEMGDEDILQLLQMQAKLEEDKATKEKMAKEAEEAEAANKKVEKDSTIKVVTAAMSEDAKTDDEKEADFLFKCGSAAAGGVKQLSELIALIEGGINVRLEDKANGERPLHKLARVTIAKMNDPGFIEKHAKLVEVLLAATKAQCEKAGKDLIMDINAQEANGKSPLFLACEFANLKMQQQLLGLGTDGPNVLLQNKKGWTVLHAALNAKASDEQVEAMVKDLVGRMTKGRATILANTKDDMGRTPLHVAAYKASEATVGLLMDLGAKNQKDGTGNTAGQLAAKKGRRRSRELIENS